jgi:histidinol-phosphatase (PHP family)
MNSGNIPRVSVHGGHSGQFCNHASDSLEAVISAYVEAGYTWVGITEHMPPLNDASRYPDEAADGLSAASLQDRFSNYFSECRRLQALYADRIRIFTAFETETYPGSFDYVKALIETTRPDYIVGSVHHVDGIGIDYNRSQWEAAADQADGVDQLYCRYFDAQYEMIRTLKPAVVGHFDLIRIFDPDYQVTLQVPEVRIRWVRNLALIRSLDLIMDFNMRGFDKTSEQYPSLPVLEQALKLGIAIVPGDDSHGVSSVGRNYERGVKLLAGLGHSCQWRQPKLYDWSSQGTPE